jgi:hypothetical protein
MKKIFLGLLLTGAMALPLGMATTASANYACERAIECECNDTYSPVCTTDQRTYSNACYALRDGKHIARNGKCTEAYFTPVQSNWHPYNWYNRDFVQGYYQPTYYTPTYITYRRPTYSNYGYYVPFSRPLVRSASYYYPRW